MRFYVLVAANMNMAFSWVLAPCILVDCFLRLRSICFLYRQGDIALMLEADCISEALVNFYEATRRRNLEGSHLHIRRQFITTVWHHRGTMWSILSLMLCVTSHAGLTRAARHWTYRESCFNCELTFTYSKRCSDHGSQTNVSCTLKLSGHENSVLLHSKGFETERPLTEQSILL